MPRAEMDLLALYDWIGAGSSDAAQAWYLGLRDAIRTLQNTPGRCPLTPEDRQLRHLLYGAKPHVYWIIYRVIEDRLEVDVLHIRHGARHEFRTADLA
jgi:plasmid stabilization system protein ParE